MTDQDRHAQESYEEEMDFYHLRREIEFLNLCWTVVYSDDLSYPDELSSFFEGRV